MKNNMNSSSVGLDKLNKVYDFITFRSEPPFSFFETEICDKTGLTEYEVRSCMKVLSDILNLVKYQTKDNYGLYTYYIKEYKYSVLQ